MTVLVFLLLKIIEFSSLVFIPIALYRVVCWLAGRVFPNYYHELLEHGEMPRIGHWSLGLVLGAICCAVYTVFELIITANWHQAQAIVAAWGV